MVNIERMVRSRREETWRQWSKNKRKWYGFGCAVLVLLVVIAVFGRGQIIAQLDDWKLLPRPERQTELYFEDQQNLPTHYKPGDWLSFRFTTRNLEFQPVNYSFEVRTTGKQEHDQDVVLETGNFHLAHDQSESHASSIEMPDMGHWAQVYIVLKFESAERGQDQSIAQTQNLHFWTEIIQD